MHRIVKLNSRPRDAMDIFWMQKKKHSWEELYNYSHVFKRQCVGATHFKLPVLLLFSFFLFFFKKNSSRCAVVSLHAMKNNVFWLVRITSQCNALSIDTMFILYSIHSIYPLTWSITFSSSRETFDFIQF